MHWGEIPAGAWWLVAAAVLGVAELASPGLFLVFLAIAAATVGVATLVLPDLTLLSQLIAFAAWSVIAVMIGRRWYVDYPVATDDPLLNDRAARLIGTTVVVSDAIADGRGRITVGDGEWPATGVDQPAGTRARIVAFTNGLPVVEPLDPDVQGAG